MSGTAEITPSQLRSAPASEASWQRWYVLAVLVLAYGVHNLDKQIVAVLTGPLKVEFGMSDLQVSMLGGLAVSVPFAFVCIPTGMLADRRNRKMMTMIVLAAWSLATALYGFAASLSMLFLSRVLVGGLEAGFSPLSMSLIADNFHPRQRSTALGLFALGAPMGTFLSMAAGAYVAADLGWRWAFFLAGIPGLVLVAVIALTIREPVHGRFEASGANQQQLAAVSLSAVLRYMVRERALLHAFVGMALCVCLLASIAVWLPTFMVRVHALNIKQVGLWSAIVVGAIGASGAVVVGGYAADRITKGKESRELVLVIATNVLAALALLAGLSVVPGVSMAMVCVGVSAFFAQTVLGTGYGSRDPAGRACHARDRAGDAGGGWPSTWCRTASAHRLLAGSVISSHRKLARKPSPTVWGPPPYFPCGARCISCALACC